ncbi:hypothetical protein GPALN_012589 [Globodera pallida]|nr:hypothetical protein GPALN_012589 [Globodera pallida]
MAALHSYISSILLVSMTTLSPSNAFLSVGEGFCGVPSGLLCSRCCCCCPQPRPCGCCCPYESCPPPPPRCCLCQPPPVMAWAPPSPCTACHSVARRCCPPPPPPSPPPQPLWAPPSPFFQQQQQQFIPPVHQQLFMGSDFNGVAATSFGVGGQTAAAHLPPPVVMTEAQQQQQQQQRIQPIIYVLGGNSKQSHGDKMAFKFANDGKKFKRKWHSAGGNCGRRKCHRKQQQQRQNNAGRDFVGRRAEQFNDNNGQTFIGSSAQFDSETESEAQALDDYEEEKKRGEEDPKTISVNKAAAASKLFKMGMGLLQRETNF